MYIHVCVLMLQNMHAQDVCIGRKNSNSFVYDSAIKTRKTSVLETRGYL